MSTGGSLAATFNLLPWEPRVSAKCSALELRVFGGRGVTAPAPVSGVNEAHGFFAVYENEVFAAFRSTTSDVAILIGGEIWLLTPDVTMSWQHPSQSKRNQRTFEIKATDRSAFLRYGGVPWYKPWEIIIEMIAPDDWWGPTCDLPSWVESGWSAGDLHRHLDEHLELVRNAKSPEELFSRLG